MKGPAFTELLERVLGEPNHRLSDLRRGELRYGTRGSLSVKVPPHPKAGLWYDYEAGVGGGLGQLELHLRGVLALTPSTSFEGKRSRVGESPDGDRGAYAARLWGTSEVVGLDGRHPVRRWMEARKLWRPEVPVPAALRWLSGGDAGGGRILALAAPPQRWIAAWPGVPQLEALQRVPVDSVGNGAGPKKSLGPMSGSVLVFGPPAGSPEACLAVCEGIADGLAVAARSTATVVVVFGTSAMVGASRNGLGEYLASFGGGVEVWADRDLPSDGGSTGRRFPAGGRAAYAVKRAVEEAGGSCQVFHPGGGMKDVAERAAVLGFGEVDDARMAIAARRLSVEHCGWPSWQVLRLAALLA